MDAVQLQVVLGLFTLVLINRLLPPSCDWHTLPSLPYPGAHYLSTTYFLFLGSLVPTLALYLVSFHWGLKFCCPFQSSWGLGLSTARIIWDHSSACPWRYLSKACVQDSTMPHSLLASIAFCCLLLILSETAGLPCLDLCLLLITRPS